MGLSFNRGAQGMPEPDRTAGSSRDIAALTRALTLEEKAVLTVGIDTWRPASCPRLGIPSVRTTDGPNGARGDTRDHVSITPCLHTLGNLARRDLGPRHRSTGELDRCPASPRKGRPHPPRPNCEPASSPSFGSEFRVFLRGPRTRASSRRPTSGCSEHRRRSDNQAFRQ